MRESRTTKKKKKKKKREEETGAKREDEDIIVETLKKWWCLWFANIGNTALSYLSFHSHFIISFFYTFVLS